MTLCSHCLAELGSTYPPGLDPAAFRPTPRAILGVLWARGTWVTSATIARLVWGDYPPAPVTLRTQIWALRRALPTPYKIENRTGYGYRLR